MSLKYLCYFIFGGPSNPLQITQFSRLKQVYNDKDPLNTAKDSKHIALTYRGRTTNSKICPVAGHIYEMESYNFCYMNNYRKILSVYIYQVFSVKN